MIQANSASRVRYHDMDMTRSIILITGVFFHAALVFGHENFYILDSHFQLPGVLSFLNFIRSFRMESLFLVSGFFSGLLISRSGSGGFYRNRLIRMGLPLLFCGLVLNTLMFEVAGKSAFLDPVAYFRDGHWKYHLWNVANLLIYETLLFVGLRALPTLHGKLAKIYLHPGLVVAVVLLACMALTRVYRYAPEVPWTHVLAHFPQFVHYLPHYVLGYVLFQNRPLLESLLRWKIAMLAVVVTTILSGFWQRGWLPGGTHTEEVLNLTVNLARTLLLFSVMRVASFDSRWIRKLSISSYTVYVLHLPVQVFLFAWTETFASAWLAYAVLAFGSFAICFGFHVLVVERFGVMGWLFNGKDYTKSSMAA